MQYVYSLRRGGIAAIDFIATVPHDASPNYVILCTIY